MSNRYSDREYMHMVQCYEDSGGNSAKACRLYVTRGFVEEDHVPAPKTIQGVVQRLRETGSYRPSTIDGGRPSIGSKGKKKVIKFFTANPSQSIRAAARVLKLNNMYVCKVLQAEKSAPPNLSQLQNQLQPDLPARVRFCEWLLEDRDRNILWTDEMTFTSKDCFNMYSSGQRKREKLPEEFGAETIDNTAPPKKILDDIEQTNHKAFIFLNNTRRPRHNTKNYQQNLHSELPGHPLTAFPDDWEGDLSTDYFEPFPYKCGKPRMITPLTNTNKHDPVSELLKLKHEWFTKYVNMKQSCSTYKVNLIEKLTELNDEVVSCPKHFVDMAEHLEADPDPYLDSSANWYYAGHGNMQLVYFNYTEYMLCSEFNICYLYEFNKDELTFSPEAAASFDCGKDNNIFESICSSQDIIALRTKLKVFVLKIVTSNDLINIEQLKVSESEIPLTSISFDEYHKNILYVTDVNNDLKIVNLDRLTARTIKLKNKIRSLVNNWSSVIGSERPYFTHVAGNSINLYDKRTNQVIHTWQSLSEVSDDTTCNVVSAAKYSPGSPYLYFGTNHHLFLMDLRYQTNTKLKLIQRWTHGMQCYPTYMSICNFEFNKELVSLSSQWCEDTCVVPNYIQSLKGSGFHGVTLPYRPPSILRTLNEARVQALCHDVYNSLENRLVTGLTGSLLIEQGEKYIILSQNGLGDISSHILYPEHMEMFVEDDSVQALHDWSQDNETEKKDFEVSFVRDISKVWKKLKKIPDGALNEQFTEETKFSEQEIHDMFESGELDEGLLDVWVDKDETNVEDLSLGLSLNITKE